MRYRRYTIMQGDTLESIAQSYLGSIDRAPTLAALNNLRYPFVSDDPRDRLASLLGTTVLSQPVQQGAVLSVAQASPSVFPDGGYVVLQGVGGVQGQAFADIVQIWGTAQGTGGQGQLLSPALQRSQAPLLGQPLPQGDAIVIDGGLAHAYAAGTRVWGYPDQSQITTRVVKTGDVILLPLPAGTSHTLSAEQGDLVEILGIDLALDGGGFLTLTQGSPSLVEGAACLQQALRIRLSTREGELAAAPDYGNAALAELGKSDAGVGVRVYAGMIKALLADPRIARVQNIVVGRAGDTVGVVAAVAVRDRNDVISVANLILSTQQG